MTDQKKHSRYFKPVARLDYVDVYRVLLLFGVTDPCLQHAIKKLLVPGGRGGGKDASQDVQEAIDSLKRWQEMREEELHCGVGYAPDYARSEHSPQGVHSQRFGGEHA